MKANYQTWVVKDKQAALRELLQLTQEEPQSTWAWRRLAECYAREMSDLPKALEAAEKFRLASSSRMLDSAVNAGKQSCCRDDKERDEQYKELIEKGPVYSPQFLDELKGMCGVNCSQK